MKLKYKKIILLTSLSTMGIGLLTLSISQNGSKAQEQLNKTSQVESGNFDSDDNVNNTDINNDSDTGMRVMATLESGEGHAVASIPSASPTPSPTPTPLPIYPLEEIEGMDEFIEEFYIAKTACDVEKLKTLYDDPSKVETREQLQSMVQYIEEYKNIKTYSKKSIEEGAYIVYAYHEIKFSGINTLAPGLSKFYVRTDKNGNFKIVSDLSSPMIEEYFNARNEDEDVLELIEMTNKKSEEAKANDEDLMLFWNALDELARKNENQAQQNN